jgi:hypothetical protein
MILTLLLTLSQPTAWAAPPPEAAEPPEEPTPGPADFRGHVDQAQFYIRKRWYADAERELLAAIALPDGRLDPEAWFLLAQVRTERTDLPGAREAAHRAWSYARDDAQLQAASSLATWLDREFGVLRLDALHMGVTANVDIQLESTIFDPDLKLFLARTHEARGRRYVLPTSLGLPAGTYRVNGQQVEVPGGGEASVTLSGRDLRRGVQGALQRSQLEVDLGALVWVGQDTSHLLPAPTAQIAWSQPVGRVVFGVLTDLGAQPYQTLEGDLGVSLASASLGARAGFELPRTRPLVIRPSVGWRTLTVPGMAAPCREGAAGVVCGSQVDPQLVIYTVGRAHAPFLELQVDYLDRMRARSWGVGVKGSVERAFGTLPAYGTARWPGEDTSFPYTLTDDTRFTALGIRVLADVSMAF